MEIVSIGKSKTERPARYGKQLAAHMGRRHGGGWDTDSETGWILFDGARAGLSCEPDQLVITLETDDAEQADRLQDVIERHLVRFGEKDGLAITWSRPSI